MSGHFDPDCCTWDEDGNPDVCLGPPKEEPDCYRCADTGRVGGSNCPDCNPTRRQIKAQLRRNKRELARRAARVAAGIIDPPEEAPF